MFRKKNWKWQVLTSISLPRRLLFVSFLSVLERLELQQKPQTRKEKKSKVPAPNPSKPAYLITSVTLSLFRIGFVFGEFRLGCFPNKKFTQTWFKSDFRRRNWIDSARRRRRSARKNGSRNDGNGFLEHSSLGFRWWIKTGFKSVQPCQRSGLFWL